MFDSLRFFFVLKSHVLYMHQNVFFIYLYVKRRTDIIIFRLFEDEFQEK